MRRDDDRVGRRGVAADDDAPAGARLPHDLLGRDARDRLAALQASEVRPRLDAEPGGELGVEAARARVLDERVAERGAAVADGERDDLQVVAADRLVGLEVADRQAVARAAEDRAHALEQGARAGRAVDGQRLLAVAQLEGLQHPRQPEPVVGVQVRQEDVGQVGEPDGAHELALRALAAVDEDALAAAPDEQRRKPAARRRNRARGAREEERQIHAARVLRAVRVARTAASREGIAMLKEFRQFILRGNLVDLAVAVVIGTAFTARGHGDRQEHRDADHRRDRRRTGLLGPDVHDQRQQVPATAQFINALLAFLIIAAVVFFLVIKPVNVLMDRFQPDTPVDVKTRGLPGVPERHPGRGDALCVLHVAGAGAAADAGSGPTAGSRV